MPYRLLCAQIPIATVLVILMIARSSSAQDAPGNGQGYMPMSPAGPAAPANFNRSSIPSPPMQPATASRPATWPGQAEPEASPWVPPDQRSGPPAGAVPAAEMKPCDGTRIIARVGSEAILESEVLGTVNKFLADNKDRIPPDQMDAQRELLEQKLLTGLIETKLIFHDAKRTIPTEAWSHVESQLTKRFEEVELDKMMQKAEANTRREFDQKLRALGTSLEREKRAFIERSLAQEWVHQQVKPEEEIAYDQMVAYYRDHVQDFTTPARAQWEELMVRFAKYPTKAAAYEAIARMGNQVWAGTPWAEVAKAGSDGLAAADGGRCRWTSQGALACQQLDAALFTLPVGQLSPIIESTKGYHIIRVTDRELEVVKPFLQAQVDIKKKIADQRSQKQFREYLAKLQARTPVWNIFEDKHKAVLEATPRQSLLR